MWWEVDFCFSVYNSLTVAFSPVSPTPSPSGTMVKEYLWWSTRTRRCMSQPSFLVTCSHPATTMMKRKRSQVSGGVLKGDFKDFHLGIKLLSAFTILKDNSASFWKTEKEVKFHLFTRASQIKTTFLVVKLPFNIFINDTEVLSDCSDLCWYLFAPRRKKWVWC